MMGLSRQDDTLGYLIPPGQLRPSGIEQLLATAMERKRFTAGLGVPSVPTRYVVAMNPSDRAWLGPGIEDQLARALERHAEETGLLIIGPLEVEFDCDADLAPGRPRVWCGFAGEDLLVLAGPEAALDVFTRAPA